MVAIVTILGLSGAHAMAPAHHQDAVSWGVVGTQGNDYIVTAVTANSFCSSSDAICKVQSEAMPDQQTGRLSKDLATPDPNAEGTFHK